MVYLDQGRLDEALDTEQESLAIREQVLGPDHLHVALSLSTLGEIYRRLDRPAEGEEPGRRALAISEASLGADHPETVGMRENLAATLLALGKVAEAESLGPAAE